MPQAASRWSILKRGSHGAEIGNWQRFLRNVDATDDRGDPIDVDENFGPQTEQATKHYQADAHLTPDGIVGPLTRARARLSGFVPFVQAKNCYVRSSDERSIRLIVIHTMESSEKPGTAESIARWFANESAPRYPAPRASAHYAIDPEATIQCVRDRDVAWGAPGRLPDGTYVNDRALHVEHAGFARQTESDWADGPSRLILWRSSNLVRRLCLDYVLPMVRVDVEGLKAGHSGITGHADLSKAFGGSHWDPGPGFPWTSFLAMVRGE